MTEKDRLGVGVFTIPQAARLLDVRQNKLRGWVCGYPKVRVKPLVGTMLGKLENTLAISFVNLMEARWVAAFAALGLDVRKIRRVLDEARDFADHPHPFATNRAYFKTDKKKIYGVVKAGKKLHYLDLESKNWAMPNVTKKGLVRGTVEYGPDGNARVWTPMPYRTPDVIVDPRFAFGAPILREQLVPTNDLFQAYLDEGDRPIEETYKRVAAWYGVQPKLVREAVDFEATLARVA